MVGYQCAVCGHESDSPFSDRCDVCNGKAPSGKEGANGARALLVILFMVAMTIAALHFWSLSAVDEPCGWRCLDELNAGTSVAAQEVSTR